MKTHIVFSALLVAIKFLYIRADCDEASNTEADGSSYQPPEKLCPGDLIFEDNFDSFDDGKWLHLDGENPSNGEFQLYVSDETNSYTQDGNLHIKPTIEDRVKSARLVSQDSFFFRYGVLEVRAKLPAGDWLWPAVWMMPKDSVYGNWPASGEIDLMESRGNKELIASWGANIGTQQVASTLHWGPDPGHNQFMRTHWEKNNPAGFDTDFHTYKVVWHDTGYEFFVDDEQIGSVYPPEGGFWELGQLQESGIQNPWRDGSQMAPFDQKFYIILNVAVGATNSYFPDDATNPGGKPWRDDSPNAQQDFWDGRSQWEPTWNTDTDQSHLIIDYVRVYAI